MVTSLRALGFLSPIRLDVCVEFHSVLCLLVPVRLLQSKAVTLHIRPGFGVNTAVLSRMQITHVCLFLLLLWFPFSKVALCHWTTNPIFPEASWEANSTSGIISSPTRCTTYVTIAPHHLPHYHILSDLGSGLKLTPPHPLWKSILRSASSRWRVLQARTNGGNLGTEEREAESGCHQRRRKGCWVGKGRGWLGRDWWPDGGGTQAALMEIPRCASRLMKPKLVHVSLSFLLHSAGFFHYPDSCRVTPSVVSHRWALVFFFVFLVSEQHLLFVFAKLDVFITTWSSHRVHVHTWRFPLVRLNFKALFKWSECINGNIWELCSLPESKIHSVSLS